MTTELGAADKWIEEAEKDVRVGNLEQAKAKAAIASAISLRVVAEVAAWKLDQ